MSETTLKILLSELQKVRITCKNRDCGAVLETPLVDLGRYLPSGICRYCNKPLYHGNKNLLIELAEVIKTLTGATDTLELEFVLPVKTDEGR